MVCKRYEIPDVEDEAEVYQGVIRRSRAFRNPQLMPSCEAVVADNLYLRRVVLGYSYEEVAQVTQIPVRVIKKYEKGKRRILLHLPELVRIAIYYLYPPEEFQELFLYGAVFHDLFEGEPFVPDKSTLNFCRTPFFKSNC